MIKKEDIQKLAELSRITVAEDEVEALASDIESIVNYVSLIKEVTSQELVPEVGTERNVMREDGEPHKSGIHTKTLLHEAPKSERGYVKVKKILAQD